jgi:hypothetical protein
MENALRRRRQPQRAPAEQPGGCRCSAQVTSRAAAKKQQHQLPRGADSGEPVEA